jgi:colanic acid/amylovoran biosynthesis protein
MADISFGDCYLEGKADFNGKSSVVVRTRKGEEIFDKYSYLFALEKESIEEIRKSQHLMDKRDNLEYAKLFIKENSIYFDIDFKYERDLKVAEKLAKLQKYIIWGKNYNINKIKATLFLSKIMGKLRAIYSYIITAITVGIIIGESFLICCCGRRKRISRKITAGNIIIVGGELFNKGAQAMTFTVVDQIKKRFPNKNIYLFSTRVFDSDDEEKSIYNFNILPFGIETQIWLLGFFGKMLKKNSECEHTGSQIKEIIKNAASVIDISGYALSSQWGWFSQVKYLLKIIIARKYSIPYYIFPQSIGPFDYPLKYKIFLYPLMKFYLKYPQKIFTREKEGLRCVCKFTKKNVEKSYDIVLQSKGYNLANIYNRDVLFKDIKIEQNAVGIIPNSRVIERANPDEIFSVYNSLINRLIDAKKNVYLLRHSYEDLEVCEKIKNLFLDNKSVRLIPDDLNAIELENLIKQFDFVIASRYHSIVHSYKNGVPALVIGWATKYFELLEDFNQSDYFFDVRDNIYIDEINNKIDKLMRAYKYEREKIIDKMNAVRKENVFDIVFGSTEKK